MEVCVCGHDREEHHDMWGCVGIAIPYRAAAPNCRCHKYEHHDLEPPF